jgi:alpha-2-macroglobulin
MLAFRDRDDVEGLGRWSPPLLFAIVDTHLTLKVDASGKIMVQATDISTGQGRSGMEVRALRNISRTHIEKWNTQTSQVDKEYIPLSDQSFATGISLPKTDTRGFSDMSIDTLSGIEWYDSNPYNLAFQSWWNYEGRYDSFLVESRGGGHLGYVVSTWNDGITGYNFGIPEYDYSWQSRALYTTYIHTDRKLYMPGEKVYVHAIMRKNGETLEVPKDTDFEVVISDPSGREVKRTTLRTTPYGSLAFAYDLPKSSPLGAYTVNITTLGTTEYIENAYTSFQVEVFRNPTFTASVELRSQSLEWDHIKNLRKTANTDPYTPWYKDAYTGDLTIEWIVKARYYNGADVKNAPFTYRVYKSEYYPDDYFKDCFWWCYYTPDPVFLTEGSGSIDGEWYGIVRIPLEYASSVSDYQYTVEVTLRDPLSSEEVTTPGSLVVKLPSEYTSVSVSNPLVFTPKKRILSPTESLMGSWSPEYGKWDAGLLGHYRYEVIARTYDQIEVDDIRMGKTRVTHPTDTIVSSGTISSRDFSLRLATLKSGEYIMRTTPLLDDVPESAIHETTFYITGDRMDSRDATLRVIPEKTVYKAGETARVLIQIPFTGSTLLITKEKWWVIDRETLFLTGNTLVREYVIDGTFLPNAYIGVVALDPRKEALGKWYAVWYGEIVTDIADQKWLITLVPDKPRYKNRETVSLDLTFTDRSGSPLTGELSLMVVDESLIRILGNIDLDVMAKFFQKYPFTVKTALSAIGIERGQFLSRKWSNGGGW